MSTSTVALVPVSVEPNVGVAQVNATVRFTQVFAASVKLFVVEKFVPKIS